MSSTPTPARRTSSPSSSRRSSATSRASTSARPRKNLTAYDVLKIASMIEREVQVPEERELVSEVIYNRLENGEPLGIDATLRYALDNFDKPLTRVRPRHR